MSRGDDNVVQFLIGLGVLTEDDVKSVQEAQVGPIVSMMIEKNTLSETNQIEATKLISGLMSSTNHMKRLRDQMALVKLVTGKMQDRMSLSRDNIRRNKERITASVFPIGVPAMAKIHSD